MNTDTRNPGPHRATKGIAALLRAACRPQGLKLLLAFVAGQMTWAAVVVAAITGGINSQAFVPVVGILAVLTAFVWVVLAYAVLRLAFMGACFDSALQEDEERRKHETPSEGAPEPQPAPDGANPAS